MAAVFHDESKDEVLQSYLDAHGSDLKVRLFKSNTTVVRGNNMASYTEADFSGYAQQSAAFGAAALDGANDASSAGGPYTFTHSGGATANTVYGWLLYDNGTGKVVFGDNFASPVVLASGGDYVSVTLPLKCKQA